MADLDEIKKKQADAARYAMRMTEEKDPKRLLEMAEEMQKRAAELGKMAKAMEAALTPDYGGGAEVQVKLTPEQKARVTEQTGAGIEVVTLRESKKRVWSQDFAAGKVEPREVEKEAAREGARLRTISETRKNVEKIIKELEKLDVPELKETIADLKRDPTLGVGKKK
jgi:hypothetical protein